MRRHFSIVRVEHDAFGLRPDRFGHWYVVVIAALTILCLVNVGLLLLAHLFGLSRLMI